MRTLANGVDPDEMLHDSAFRLGLDYNDLLRKKYNLEIIHATCDPRGWGGGWVL